MNPSDFIKVVRESFGSSVTVYTEGSCYRFYLILKEVFPEARAWYDEIAGHVYTEIDGELYDIHGGHGELDNRPACMVRVPNPDLSETELLSWRYN